MIYFFYHKIIIILILTRFFINIIGTTTRYIFQVPTGHTPFGFPPFTSGLYFSPTYNNAFFTGSRSG